MKLLKITSLFLCLAWLTAVGGTLPVPNNSFEDTLLPGQRLPDGWRLWEKFPRQTEITCVPDAARGTWALRVMNPTDGGANLTVPGGIACAPGETYTFSIWAKSEGSVSAAITMQVRDADGIVLTHSLGGNVVLPREIQEWTRFTITATVPENGQFISPHMVNNGGTVLWDAAQIDVGTTSGEFQPTPKPELPAFAEFAEKPLIQNADFEAGDVLPAQWSGSAAAQKIAARDTVLKRGTASLRLVQAQDALPWRSEIFPLDPKCDYVLSAWVRSQNLNHGVGEFYVECLTSWGTVAGTIGKGEAYREAAGVFVSQTSPWQQRSAYVGKEDMPPGTVAGRAVCVLRPYADGDGVAWFDDLRFTPARITARGSIVAAGVPVNDFLLDQGTEAVLSFQLYSPMLRNKTTLLRLAVNDFFNKTVIAEENQVSLDSNGTAAIHFPVPDTLAAGHFTTRLEDEDGNRTYQLTFGVVPPSLCTDETVPESPYGICHLTKPEFLSIAQRAGFKWTRGGRSAKWSVVERKEGVFDFGSIREWRQSLVDHGLLKLTTCSGIPKWAQQDIDGVVVVRGGRSRRSQAAMSLPKDLGSWQRYIETTTRELASFGGAWEIWNEADIPGFWADSDENYLRLLNASYEPAKRGNPDAPILMTGITGGFLSENQTHVDPQSGREINRARFLERVLSEGGNAFDIINFHSYGGAGNLEKRLQRIQDLARGHDMLDRPIWITETGGPTHSGSRGFTEAEQAILYIQTHVLARAYGAEKVFWHCFYDWGRDITYHEHNFGLIHYDHTPKPALLAQASLARWFGTPTFLRQESLGRGTRYFEFEKKSQPLGVLWSTAPEVLFTEMEGTPEIRNCMGGKMAVATTGGIHALSVDEKPLFLLGARIIRVLPPLLTPATAALRPGTTQVCRVICHNVAGRQLDLTVRLSPPTGWKVEPTELHLTPQDGQEKSTKISVSAPSGTNPGTYELVGRVDTSGAPLQLTVARLQICLPLRELSGSDVQLDGNVDDWPDFDLEIGPDHTAAGTVKNAADLSAQFQLSWCDRGLLLAARVRDDLVSNPNRLLKPWIGDAVEVFIDGRETGKRGKADADGVRQIFLIPPTPECPVASWVQTKPESPVDGPIHVVGRLQDDGYTLEALLPWPADSATYREGSAVALNVAVDDLDERPDADNVNADIRREAQIVWSGGSDVYRNAANHVPAQLEGSRDRERPKPDEIIPQGIQPSLPFNGDAEFDVNLDGTLSESDGWTRLAAWGPEDGTVSWSRNGGMDGKGALRISGVSNCLAWQTVKYPLLHDVEAYRVQARVRRENPGAGTVAVKLAFYAADGHWVGTPTYAQGQAADGNPGDWETINYAVPRKDIPSEAAFWRVICLVKGAMPGNAFYDKIQVTADPPIQD